MMWQSASADQLARQLVNAVLLLGNTTESVDNVAISVINISMCTAYTINAQISDVAGILT